ncbi:hypothetical protein EVA_13376, partial [gut metagenome]
MDVVGYDSYDMDPTTYNRQVSTNFQADQTIIDTETVEKNANAIGMLTAANDLAKPKVTVQGDLTIKSLSHHGKAYGISHEYSDASRGDNEPGGGNAPVYPLEAGWIKAQKNVTMDIRGESEAYGVFNQVGQVEIGGQSGDVNITVEAGKSHGLYATSNGVIRVGGNQATINAKGQQANALTITANDNDTGVDYQPGTPTIVLASKETTLNGKTFTEEGTRLEL